MTLYAGNISVQNWPQSVTIRRSTLGYNDRRRYAGRLKRLYNYLSGLKPSQYDHSSIVTKLTPKAPACGSVACAFGHAVISGKFPDIHATATLRSKAKPNADGSYFDGYIKYKVTDQAGLRRSIKAKGFTMTSSHVSFGTAADEYFGPGAWDAIFSVEGYPFSGNGRPTKAVVMNRIKTMVEKGYGIKFPPAVKV